MCEAIRSSPTGAVDPEFYVRCPDLPGSEVDRTPGRGCSSIRSLSNHPCPDRYSPCVLLEREGLLESLRERLDEATTGSGSMVLVAGEAGAGKTALLRVFAASLGDSALTIQGACDPLSTPRPLSPLRDFAADPDAGLADLDFDRDPIHIFNEVLDRLRHTIRPIVMVVEDIHWADDATLDFLRFIGRRVHDSKSVVVCTYRDDEVGPDHALRSVLGQLIPLGSTERLVVPCLSLDAVTRLVADRPIDARALFQVTDGNPFFVTEVLESGEELPSSVQEAVLARVARLADSSRRAVEAVSIAPRALEVEKVMALVGSSPETIDRAVGSGVLLEDGLALRFRHELAREAIEGSIPPARRLEMHRQMIALLLEDDTRDLARLAHHAIKGGSPELIVEYAPEAAREAVRRGARREAVSFCRAALEYPEVLGADEAAALRVTLGTELRLLDEPSASVEEFHMAIEHFRHVGATEELADVLGLLQGSLWNLGRFDQGWEAMNEAVALLRPLGPTEALGRTLYRVAHHHMLARHARPAFYNIAEARSVAEATGSGDIAWLVSMMTGCIHIVVGDADEGVRLLGEAVAKAEEMENPRFLSLGLGMLGSGGGEARRYETATDALERGVEQGMATDEDYGVAYDRSWLARIAFEQARWDDAVALAEAVSNTTLQRSGIAYITAMSALGRARVRRGDPGGLQLLEEMVELARAHELQHGWNAICGRTEHMWLKGRARDTLDELEPAHARALDTDSEWARGEIGFWMWKAGAIDGPPEGAAEPFALQMAGEWRAAAKVWEDIGCPYEVAMALADGDVEARLESLEILDSLGARPMAEKVRTGLRELGVDAIPRGPNKATLANPGRLTPRQLEVVRLIADGLTNDQIAEELYVSKKTVEHHVSAIYAKLGVESRTQAVKAAGDAGALKTGGAIEAN
jgi:DNA-binding CsgD family transcriptional regulator